MNIEQLFKDFGIEYFTEGKYTHAGWINVECPFCTSIHKGPHLGYELATNHFHCWACGFHSITDTLSLLLNLSKKEVFKIIKLYENDFEVRKETPTIAKKLKETSLPSNISDLSIKHIAYLYKRKFDPDKLKFEWGLKGTGPISLLNSIDYSHRIFIPFYWDGKLVSFDTRDVTEKHRSKYMACPKELELIEHKKILYGKQDKWKSTAICVEGPTDVWRFGYNSFAVSGIAYRPEQVRLIAKTFKRVGVCFDGQESQAKKQANKLVNELRFRGVDSFRIDIIGDPGDMDQKEANYLVKQICGS